MNNKKTSKTKSTRIQEQNRQRILEASLTVFSRHGFRGTRIDQIAEVSGMSRSNLLYYFKRKEDIYRAVLNEILAEWLEPLRAISADGDPRIEIGAYIRAKCKMASSAPEASRLFANEILQGAPMINDILTGPLKTLVDEKAKVLQNWMDKGQIRRMSPHHLIFAIWATTQHYSDFDHQIKAILGKSITDKEFGSEAAHSVEDLLLHGMLPRHPAPNND